jgi:hypothetical protein
VSLHHQNNKLEIIYIFYLTLFNPPKLLLGRKNIGGALPPPQVMPMENGSRNLIVAL